MIKTKLSKKVLEEEKLFIRNPNDNIYLLDLNEKGESNIQDDQFLRLPNFSRLIFKLYNGSPISKNCFLLTNYGTDVDVFGNIKTLKKGDDNSNLIKHYHTNIDTCIYFSLDLTNSGGYFFQICYEEENGEINFTPEIWIVIDPFYKLGNKSFDINSINMQTILSKSLGKLETWENYYKEASSLNYNFVHFTPVQPTGQSESLYCLDDQTDINNLFFNMNDNEKSDKKLKNDIFEDKIMTLQHKYNLLGVVDIVLNHTSNNSQWLYDNPDSGYNLVNSPHLTCAFLLDELILNFSNRYTNKKVSCPSAPYINNENDLNSLIGALSCEIKKLQLEDYFLINIADYVEKLKIIYKELKSTNNEYLEKKILVDEKVKKLQNNDEIFNLILNNCKNHGASKYGVVLNYEIIGLLLFKDGKSINLFINEFLMHINKINDFWKVKALGFINEAIQNIKKTIHYEFIQNKVYKVTEKKRLSDNYFSPWKGDSSDYRRVFANNGWLFGSDNPTINFALYGQWDYLKRSIVIWGDCSKLRYGDKPSDSEFLWQHMSKYVQNMAKCFNGFRLDNSHSTPIYVAQYLINVARKTNPHLLIIAELFAGTKEKEIEFVKKIGINLLIREMIWCGNANEIGTKLHRYGGGIDKVLGKIDEESQMIRLNNYNNTIERIKYKQLIGQYPSSIIFDVTHDNITLFDKTGNLALNLPILATVGLSLTAVATTRGFDQLFFYQPSVVNENRLYLYEKLDNYEEMENSKTEIEKLKTKLKSNGSTQEVFFEYHNLNAKSVRISISALNWSNKFSMVKNDGKFSITLNLINGVHYFKYIIDDKDWVFDNTREIFKDKAGHVNNVIRVGVDPYPPNKIYNDLKIVRKEINIMRKSSAERKNEYYIHQENDVIVIFRLFHDIDPNDDHSGYVLISRPVYDKNNKTGIVFKVELPGIISELVFAANINVPDFDGNSLRSNKDFLLGVKGNVEFTRNINFLLNIAKVSRENNKEIIEFSNLKPNMVFLLKVKHLEEIENSLFGIRKSILDFCSLNEKIKLSALDINHILFKCEKEELHLTNGKRGVYNIPNFGKVVYAGIAHYHLIMNKTKVSQELSHPIYINIRAGDWLLSFSLDRIKEAKTACDIHEILILIVKFYSNLPIYLKPHYSCKIIENLYNLLQLRVIENSRPIFAKSKFTQDLLMAVFQFISNVPKCQLKSKISMAAGLPHFSTDYMRCWGRDTFISLKGLLLITGFIKEAKEIILEFASCLRHGLIPNLLNIGMNPRFNSRDSTWFFLQSVQDYILESDEKEEFLKIEVEMQFLDDNMEEHLKKMTRNEKKTMSLADIVQTIFQKHAYGISFREWNSGKLIDENMRDEGFNVKIIFDEETGFILGGNQFNCGTWMDKMGSSYKARNKGIPATPRDGANVELIGLIYSNLSFFDSLNKEKKYPYNEVLISNGKKLSYSDWMRKIKDNFENYFWIGKRDEIFTNFLLTDKNLILNEEIYKDIVKSSNKKSEYQLRPNFLIAMAVAPDLFTRSKAVLAIQTVEKHLIVKDGLGIKTLSANDPNYRGDYDLKDDSNNYNTAHGFNYHNGPEWLWPLGYYIKAKINFCNNKDLKRNIYRLFIPHMKYISSNDWLGLPELTNSNNKVCPDSCNTQAWSIATILEGFHQLLQLEENHF